MYMRILRENNKRQRTGYRALPPPFRRHLERDTEPRLPSERIIPTTGKTQAPVTLFASSDLFTFPEIHVEESSVQNSRRHSALLCIMSGWSLQAQGRLPFEQHVNETNHRTSWHISALHSNPNPQKNIYIYIYIYILFRPLFSSGLV